MEDLQFRMALPADADALVACIDAAYDRYKGRIADMPAVSAGCAAEIAHGQVWVAMLDGKITGGLFLKVQDGVMKLANLAVHPAQGGMGIGRKLISLAEAEARRQGFRELRLNTHVMMQENVVLYQRLGWVELSRQGNTVSMTKHLA